MQVMTKPAHCKAQPQNKRSRTKKRMKFAGFAAGDLSDTLQPIPLPVPFCRGEMLHMSALRVILASGPMPGPTPQRLCDKATSAAPAGQLRPHKCRHTIAAPLRSFKGSTADLSSSERQPCLKCGQVLVVQRPDQVHVTSTGQGGTKVPPHM